MKIRMNPPKYKLQPLRIPSGWEVSYNTLIELDPSTLSVEDEEKWGKFTEDLLQITHSRYHLLLDVGWYPEGDPEGCYGLELIKDFDWGNPLVDFETKQKDELVKKIELLLWQAGSGEFN